MVETMLRFFTLSNDFNIKNVKKVIISQTGSPNVSTKNS
jgi:hypothetical protein